MYQKIRSAKFKSLDGVNGAKPGTFSAVVAVYGNVDSVGDRIIEGAFDKSLRAWQALGDPIPIVLAHEWKDPFKHIGYAMPNKIKSVPGVGLVVEEGFLDVEDNPLAKQVHKLMERRTLKEFSFGYGIPQGGQTKASDGAMDLKALDLIEFGPCLKGINDKTELLSIKSVIMNEEDGMESIEDRLARIEEVILGKAKIRPNRRRWATQRRDPETGRWIDESHGAGHGGRQRTANTDFGAAKIDDIRKEANSSGLLTGSEKSQINTVLNEAEEKFLEGDNKGGEGSVRRATTILSQAGQSGINPDGVGLTRERTRTGPIALTPKEAAAQKRQFEANAKRDSDFAKVAAISSPAKQYGAAARQLEERDYEANRDAIDKAGWKLTGINSTHIIIGPKSHPDEPVDGRSAPSSASSSSKKVLNDLLDEHLGMSMDDYDNGDDSDRDQIDGFLEDVVSHEEMYPPEQVAAAKEQLGYTANEQEIASVTSQMDSVEKLLDSGADPDDEDISDIMGNLHVDMEQSEFPEHLQRRHADLENRLEQELEDGAPIEVNPWIRADPSGWIHPGSPEADFQSKLEQADKLMRKPGANRIALDNLMSDLQAASEQETFSPWTDKRYAELEKKWKRSGQGQDNQGSSVPGTVSRDDQSDTDLSASKEDVQAVNDQLDNAESLLEDPSIDPDPDALDDLMGNLHVDMEQANFPPDVEERYAALENRWKQELEDKVDANSATPRKPSERKDEYEARTGADLSWDEWMALPGGQTSPRGTDSSNKFGFSDEGSSVPGTVSRDDQSDTDLSASKEDAEMVTSNLDRAEALLDQGIDDEDLDDLMGNLHVDMEQANFPPELEKRYAALEKRWLDETTASKNGGTASSSPIGGDEDYSADADDIDNVTSTMSKVEKMLNDPNVDIDDLDWEMSNLHVDMEQAEFPAAVEKRYAALEKKWLKSPKKEKARSHLSLDAQITQMQADAAIFTATADLESKGFDLDVTYSRDNTLRRLDELEAEVM